MRNIELSDEDITQVHASLMTMSEISDMQINTSLELIARLKRDEPDAAGGTIDDLQGQVKDFELDSENLKRIALLFQ